MCYSDIIFYVYMYMCVHYNLYCTDWFLWIKKKKKSDDDQITLECSHHFRCVVVLGCNRCYDDVDSMLF